MHFRLATRRTLAALAIVMAGAAGAGFQLVAHSDTAAISAASHFPSDGGHPWIG
jgi:hypothetical protein